MKIIFGFIWVISAGNLQFNDDFKIAWELDDVSFNGKYIHPYPPKSGHAKWGQSAPYWLKVT